MANLLFGIAQKLANTLLPDRQLGPVGLKFTFPFLTEAVTTFEFPIPLGSATGLDMVQGVFIDNSQNATLFQLVMLDSGQRITVPAFSQADFEVIGLIGAPTFRVRGVTTGNVNIPVTFKNVRGQNTIWNVTDPGTVVGTVTVTGSVTTLPVSSAPVNRSMTTGALNTPQSLMAAAAGRRFLHIYNPLANSGKANGGVLTIGIGAGFTYGQAGGYDIVPGGSWMFDGTSVPSSQIFVSATDATCVVSAMEI